MPRIQIPITNVKETAVPYPVEIVGDAANDHYLPYNDGRVWLEVRNTDVGERSFTVRTPPTFGELPVKDIGIPILPGETSVVGPFNPRLYSQRADAGADAGKVFIDVGAGFMRFRAFHLDRDIRGYKGGVEADGPGTEIPITEIDVQEHNPSILVPAFTDAEPVADMNLPFNDGRVILEINNLDGANPHTAVMNVETLFPIGQSGSGPDSARPPGGAMEVSDNSIVVPAGGHVICGGFDPRAYNPNRSLQFIPGGGGTKEAVSRVQVNVTTDQLQFRAFHLPAVVG